jgi:hypothetical protein
MCRIMMYLRYHDVNRRKEVLSMSQYDMLRVIIDETRDFSRFFDDEDKRKGSIAQLKKLLRKKGAEGYTPQARSILRAAEKNHTKWGRRGDNALILLQYSDATALHMHQLLQLEDKSECLRYAQRGYITTEFLEWLLSKKEDYNRWRRREADDHSAGRLRESMDIFDPKD